jgi:predicted dinucleotide-binding enzyme
MQIAIIGSGNIGRSLGEKWAAAGHQVVFGARDPQSPKVQLALAGGAQVASVTAALAGAEAVLLALPGAAVGDFAREHGPALGGATVIDATNQFGQPVMNGLAALQVAAPGAALARAFNSLGWENFAEPQIDGETIDLFYCAAAGPADEATAQLIADVGLRPVRVGDLAQAPLVDTLGALWGALAFGQGRGRRLAFKLLTPGGA